MPKKIRIRLFNRLYLPITCVIAYLSTTMFIFEFGMIDYYTPNKVLFYLYLLYYLAALLLGYLVAISFLKISVEDRTGTMVRFSALVILTVIGSLIENANAAKLGTLVPTNIISLISSGFDLSGAGEAYYLVKASSESYSSNRALNIASFLFAWARLFLIIYVGMNIHRLTGFHILIGLGASIIYPLGALSIGLNKPVIETALLFFFAVLVLMTINKADISLRLLRLLKVWIRLGAVLILLGIWNFMNNMKGRGVTVYYLEFSSPAKYITVNCSFCSPEDWDFMTGFIMLMNYVVQGYHGFALALEQRFHSTFGFGSSHFLLRQFEVFTGTNLTPLTFQEKTDHLWGATTRWHSIYTHFANDVHFIGVGGVMFLIGGLFGFTWKLAIHQKNVYARTLIPIYAFMFIFFPANNQVFGFIASLSAFVFANIMMFNTFLRRSGSS